MEDRNFYTFPRGEPVPLSEMRRLKALADRAERGFVAGTQAVIDGGGPALAVPPPEQVGGIWLKITSQYSGSQPLYGGNEVVDEGGGTFSEPGDAIIVANNAAAEVSGNLSVPTSGSAIVRAWPAASATAEWSFSYPATSSGSLTTEYTDGTSAQTGTATLAFDKTYFALSHPTGSQTNVTFDASTVVVFTVGKTARW